MINKLSHTIIIDFLHIIYTKELKPGYKIRFFDERKYLVLRHDKIIIVISHVGPKLIHIERIGFDFLVLNSFNNKVFVERSTFKTLKIMYEFIKEHKKSL